MPNFAAAVRLNKIPATGLVAETSGTAPSAPVSGQLWTDTSSTPNVVRKYNATTTTWDPWILIGTVAGTAADAASVTLKANNLSDLASAASARTNLGLGTAAVTNTGTGAGNTILGNDSRLSDQRTPIDASVTGGTAGAGVKLAANTITAANIAAATITDVQVAAANKDGVAGTASLRTLGTGAQQALAGSTTLDAITAPANDISLNSHRITNLAAPVGSNDAARLADVQAAAAGYDTKPSVRLATTAALPANTYSNGVLTATGNGALTVDSVAVATGDRILVKNEAAAANNGIYTVTNPGSGAAAYVLTRATDMSVNGATPGALNGANPGSFTFVEGGTTWIASAWTVTTQGTVTLGTTGIVWAQVGGATAYTGTGNRITVTGTQIDIAATYVGQTSITTVGALTTGSLSAGFTAVGVAQGGTGATTAPAARTALGAPQVGYAATLGAISAGTPLVVTHSLGTQDVIAQLRDASTNEYIYADIINASTTTVTVTTGVAYGANATRIVVLPVA